MGVPHKKTKKNPIDNQPPVFYLAIRLKSKDLKHLIPTPYTPGLQG